MTVKHLFSKLHRLKNNEQSKMYEKRSSLPNECNINDTVTIAFHACLQTLKNHYLVDSVIHFSNNPPQGSLSHKLHWTMPMNT